MNQTDYDSLLATQNGVCAICGMSPDELGRRFTVDHNHAEPDAEPRGILCSYCNTGIGLFGENTELLLNAIGYITSHSVQIT
jgi:hypothetical protein